LSSIPRVLDSYSLIAYLEGEPGREKVIELIQDARDSQAALFLSIGKAPRLPAGSGR
jgi:hypothetical protein